MRGSIVKRAKGYSVVVELDRDPTTGKRRQKWHSGYRTKKAAEDALSELVNGVKTGTYVTKTKQTLTEYVEEWLRPSGRPCGRRRTTATRGTCGFTVLPYLGSTTLHAVDAGMLNGLYAMLLASGRRDHEPGGLSPRSVRYVHTIAHRAFKDAVKWGRLARNPADAADPPRASSSDRPESVTWTAEQLRTFLAGTQTDRHGTAYLVLATTGLRRGEALGLRWRDLDLDHGRAAIRQTVIAVHHTPTLGTPKTAKGRRTVSLDKGTVTALREHRKHQAVERLQMGAGWTDSDLVCCRVDGTMLHPERFSRSFGDAVQRLGLRRFVSTT